MYGYDFEPLGDGELWQSVPSLRKPTAAEKRRAAEIARRIPFGTGRNTSGAHRTAPKRQAASPKPPKRHAPPKPPVTTGRRKPPVFTPDANYGGQFGPLPPPPRTQTTAGANAGASANAGAGANATGNTVINNITTDQVTTRGQAENNVAKTALWNALALAANAAAQKLQNGQQPTPQEMDALRVRQLPPEHRDEEITRRVTEQQDRNSFGGDAGFTFDAAKGLGFNFSPVLLAAGALILFSFMRGAESGRKGRG